MLDTIGRYKIGAKLGEGGIASVFLAEDPAIGRQLAIKVIPLTLGVRDLGARILREVHVLGKLSHPNIVTLYDVGQVEEYVYIAMEYVDGPTLASLLRSTDPDQSTAREILLSVGSALDYAHNIGIVHRDIKPSNIIMASDGRVKVVDFGIARAMKSERPDDDRITDVPSVIGTVGFLSPEQYLASDEELSPATDQFSLGVVAYLLLTGCAPFEGLPFERTDPVVLKRVLPAHSLNPSLHPSVDKVFERVLAARPQRRYSSCADFVKDLMIACDRRSDWRPLRDSRSIKSREGEGTRVPPLSTEGGKGKTGFPDTTVPLPPGEFTAMFNSLADAGALVADAPSRVPTIFPEPRTTFFRAQNERFQKIEESIKFYRENLTIEYQNLIKQADLTYKLWLGCVGIGFSLLAVGVAVMFFGDLTRGVVTAGSTILVYFIQRVFHQREDDYRHAADAKSKHLQYGNQWLLVIQSVDAIEEPTERVKRQTALVDVLTDRLRLDDNPGAPKRSSRSRTKP